MDVAADYDIPARIETQRLVMRSQRRSDAPFVLDAVEETHAELQLWLGWPKDLPTIEQIEHHIMQSRAYWDLRQQHYFHLFDHEDRFLGVCGLDQIDWAVRRFDISYWLRNSAVGKGYMTEAVIALSKELFENGNCRRLVIMCDVKNALSAAIPRRAGFTLEGTLKNERLNPQGKPQDTMVWAKIATELPATV